MVTGGGGGGGGAGRGRGDNRGMASDSTAGIVLAPATVVVTLSPDTSHPHYRWEDNEARLVTNTRI